jgi:hypothetical protein
MLFSKSAGSQQRLEPEGWGRQLLCPFFRYATVTEDAVIFASFSGTMFQ